MQFFIGVLALCLAIVFGVSAHAQQDERSTIFYLGAGGVVGFDIAGEGTMLDSTYGGDEIRQALSLNFLVGSNLYKADAVRVDAAAIIGMRESFADCPDSFLGFQCYADQSPDTEYDLNLGAMISLTMQSVSLGVRATEVSTQAVIGVKF